MTKSPSDHTCPLCGAIRKNYPYPFGKRHPIKQRIFELINKYPGRLGAQELAARVGAYNPEKDQTEGCIRFHVSKMRELLRPHGLGIVFDGFGLSRGGYRLVPLVDGEPHG